ncbi:LysR family transcriptional regulator [Iningainema tapete]|uniref:LysR family transcriptional regulator n=1 Tax=Iningainema tapete BLCC-T55 TaxID=2748662 RepID=A0A8J6XJM8_9CYAN|nr:LysR family transcriptional regulator [Iningainema tapete]MBD2771562.1 LysR family transcriptional regulator [Iningainema tapete BLCC-T55]
MDRISAMKSFVRTVETGSFSAVARELETTQPTISKQIAALEEYLDVQLLTRSTRTLSLTDAGERFYEHCQRILEAVAEAEASVGRRQKPSGLLRVNCPVSFGQLQIVPRMKAFLDRYPEIKLDLMMTDRFVDLVEEGVDLAIRIGNSQDSSLITSLIGTTRRVTVGSVSYFEKFGEPQTPNDLINHNCIVYTRLSTGNEWHFQSTQGVVKVNVTGNFQANNSAAVREAVLSGLGIAVSPIWLFSDVVTSGAIKIVLKDYQPTPLSLSAVYRRSRFQPAKVRCFIDFLVDEFQIDAWVSDYGQEPEHT